MSAAAALGAALRAALPQGDVVGGAAAPEFAVGGVSPAWVATPADVEELQACLRAAAAAGAAVVPCGHGLRLGTGNPPERLDVVVSTRRLDRVVAHEAEDMTLVVQAGATLAAVDAVLAPHGQRLPIDPPFPGRTTVGGLIATDAFGPLRAAHGRVRDALIGVQVALVDGTLVRGGGRVVKNVAGYDLMKLLCGSFGTLGIVTEAAFRLRPRPAQQRAGIVACATLDDAAVRAARLAALPFTPAVARVLAGTPVAALGAAAPAAIVVGVEGSDAEVAALARSVESSLAAGIAWCDGAAAQDVLETARTAQAAAAGDALVVRAGVRPSRLPALLAAVETAAAGAPRSLAADAAAGALFVRVGGDAAVVVAEAVRREAVARGGFALFTDMAADLAGRLDPWGEVGAIGLMRGVKAALDPERRLSPGRFVGGM